MRQSVAICGSRRNGAGDGIRTRDINLGKVALYQLSYSRIRAESPLSLDSGGLSMRSKWLPTRRQSVTRYQPALYRRLHGIHMLVPDGYILPLCFIINLTKH